MSNDETYPTADEISQKAREVSDAAREARRDELAHQSGPSGPRGNGPAVAIVADDAYDYVIPWFERFSKPEPYLAEGMEVELELALGPIGAAGTELGIVNNDLWNWEGDARDSFMYHFMEPLVVGNNDSNILDNQQGLVNELRAAAGAQARILGRGREDAVSIANAAIDALESLKAMNDQVTADFTLGLAGTVVGLIPVVGTGAKAVEVGLAWLAAGGKLTSTVFDVVEQKLTGATVDSILDSTQSLLDKVDSSMTDLEDQIRDKLKATQEEGTGGKPGVDEVLGSSSALDLAKLVPNEIGDDGPDITDGKDNDTSEFRPPSLS
ncbi:MAG: hypothetical protein ACRDXX_13785 [Stackebrandtia sp.]